MSPSLNLTKLKIALKLSISRLRMSQQKEIALAKVSRRQMAQLLEAGREESARIRVEKIIRQDIQVELMEILELYCELLLARVGLLESKDCDPGLEEAVKSLIYAAPRSDIKELQTVRQLLVEKYGKEFAISAIDNLDGKVSERVLSKLRVDPPGDVLVSLYLQEIAKTYNIDYNHSLYSTLDTPYNKKDVQTASLDTNRSSNITHIQEQDLRTGNQDNITRAVNKESSQLTSTQYAGCGQPSQKEYNEMPLVPNCSGKTFKSKSDHHDEDLIRRFAALKKT